MRESHAQLAPDHGLPTLHHLSTAAHLALIVFASFLASAALGAAVATYLRRRRLAWTWGLLSLIPLSLPALLIATGAIGAATAAIVLALSFGLTLGSLGWGFRGQLEDRRAGGDREAAAAERRGLLDGARRRRAERAPRLERELSTGLPLGRTNRGQLAMHRSRQRLLWPHVLIPGATGAGKTTSLAALLVDYVARSGFGAVVLEAKTDAPCATPPSAPPRRAGRAFHLVSPAWPSAYDPLAHGSVDERSERLIAVEDWGSADADFYRQAASPFLRLALAVPSTAAPEPTTLASRRGPLRPRRARDLAGQLRRRRAAPRGSATPRGLRTDERRAIAGLRRAPAATSPPRSSPAPGSTRQRPAAPCRRPARRDRRTARSSTSASTPTAPATSAARSPRWRCSTSAPPPAR